MQTIYKVCLLLFVINCMYENSFAQSAVNLSNEQKAQFVARHNFWRDSFGTPNVIWSDSIAQYAKEWAELLVNDSCDFRHRDGSKYGENIWATSATKFEIDDIVDTWADEKKDYKGEKISTTNFMVFGHYTQVVWEHTTEIGCAIAHCTKGAICVCNYNPGGNMIGESPKTNITLSEH